MWRHNILAHEKFDNITIHGGAIWRLLTWTRFLQTAPPHIGHEVTNPTAALTFSKSTPNASGNHMKHYTNSDVGSRGPKVGRADVRNGNLNLATTGTATAMSARSGLSGSPSPNVSPQGFLRINGNVSWSLRRLGQGSTADATRTRSIPTTTIQTATGRRQTNYKNLQVTSQHVNTDAIPNHNCSQSGCSSYAKLQQHAHAIWIVESYICWPVFVPNPHVTTRQTTGASFSCDEAANQHKRVCVSWGILGHVFCNRIHSHVSS